MSFVSEEKPVAICVFNIPIQVFGLGGKKPDSLGAPGAGAEGVPVIVVMDIEIVPVVHSAATDLFIGDVETERVNEVEAALSDRAEAPDVAGILGDLGVKKDQVKHGGCAD